MKQNSLRAWCAGIMAAQLLASCGGGGGAEGPSGTETRITPGKPETPDITTPLTPTVPGIPTTPVVPAPGTPIIPVTPTVPSIPPGPINPIRYDAVDSTSADSVGGPTGSTEQLEAVIPDTRPTYYVSSAASNGIPMGSDANAGGSSAPFLTLHRALEVVPANSRIVLNCGTYVPESGTVFKLALPVSIEAVVATSLSAPSCAVLRNATNMPSTLEITGSGIDVTLRGMAIEGSGTTDQAILIRNTTLLSKIKLEGVLFNNVGGNGLAEGTAGKFSLEATKVGCLGSLTGSCFKLLTHAAGHVSIKGLTAKVQGLGGHTNGWLVSFNARVAGITATVSHVTGIVEGSSNLAARNAAVSIRNSPNASVSYMGVPYPQKRSDDFLIVRNLHPGGRCTPVVISTDFQNPIQADNPAYFNNRVQQDCVGGGHSSILWVSDGDPGPGLRNLVRHARTYNNVDMAGPHVTVESSLEGPLCGWTSDCWIFNNVIQSYPGKLNGPYGAIQKGVMGGYVFGNLIVNPAHTGLLAKGGSQWNNGIGPQFWNNRIVVNLPFVKPISCLAQVSDDKGFPATGWVFANNDCVFQVTGSAQIRFTNQNGTGNTGIFKTNNYYTNAIVSGSAWSAWDTATSKTVLATTLGGWKTLVDGERSALGINPGLGIQFDLLASSPLIAAGTAVPTVIKSDLSGLPFAAQPSIGPYQFNAR